MDLSLKIIFISGCQCQLVNTDLPGSDISIIHPIRSWFKCGQLCTINPRCVSFTWNTFLECFLKSGVPSRTATTSASSGSAICFNATTNYNIIQGISVHSSLMYQKWKIFVLFMQLSLTNWSCERSVSYQHSNERNETFSPRNTFFLL